MSSLRANIVVQPQEVFTSSTTQQTDPGALATTGDGRYFRYFQNGTTALTAGRLIGSYPQATGNNNLSVLAAAANTKAITTSTTLNLTANQFAGGFVATRRGPGSGYLYQIASHNAASAGTITFNLSDEIEVALTASSVIDAVPNPYVQAVQHTAGTTEDSVVIGVAVTTTPASNWGWVQTRGPAAVYTEVVTVGRTVGVSMGTAGAVGAVTSGTQAVVGWAMITTTDSNYDPIFLTID